jgi:NAD(P)H-nitrite reductase large subunit
MKNLPENNADYLIIGNSVAAIAAAEAIRSQSRAGSIIMVSKEPRKAYSRPLISYYLGGKVTLRGMQYRGSLFYRDNRIELLGDTEVVKVNTKEKSVSCSDGTKVGYGKLLIATGGSPIMPPIKGTKTRGVFNFTTFADAEHIKEYVDEERISDAVILGGGLIGLKAAEALMALKKKVTIVELADRILSATFDVKASQIIEKSLARQGCEIILRDSIKEIISDNGKVSEIELVSGRHIDAGLVVVAIGVRPNIELVKDSGIKTNRGIIVDDLMQTSDPDVYAAGDVAEASDFNADRNIVLAIWPDAYRQGKVAGTAMAGNAVKYGGGLAMNAVELAGVPTISVGLTDPQEDGFEVLQKGDLRSSFYKKLVFRDNVLVGAILVGKIDRAGIYTGLIKEKINTAAFKDDLLSDDFGIISLPREYRKHMVSETDVPIMQS